MPIGPGQFRLFLALCVCVSHLSRVNIGETAVCLFFMLSGYWVVRMYHEKYANLQFPNATFLISRFLRIWLLYSVCTVVSIAAFAIILGRYNPSNWIALPLLGTATHGRDVLGISWSLDIEVQFYLTVPFLASLLLSPGNTRNSVILVTACALTILGWFLADNYGIDVLLAYIVLFLAGALSYTSQLKPSGRAAIVSAIVFVLIGLLALQTPLAASFDRTQANPFNDRWFSVVWVLVLAPLVHWNVRQSSSPFDRKLGDLSYSIYLVHYPLYSIADHQLGGANPVEKLALLAATIPIALIPYLLVDRPLDRRREALSKYIARRLHRFG